MGVSLPITNLKKFEYINISETTTLVWDVAVSGTVLHYLILQKVDLSEIDQIVWIWDIDQELNTNHFDLTLDLDKTTVLSTKSCGAGNTGIEWVDVSGYSGVHILGILLDIENDTGVGNNWFQLNQLLAWGKLPD